MIADRSWILLNRDPIVVEITLAHPRKTMPPRLEVDTYRVFGSPNTCGNPTRWVREDLPDPDETKMDTGIYDVITDGDNCSCTCPGYLFHGKPCKHIKTAGELADVLANSASSSMVA
jgi:hypothetical protein